MQPALPKEAEVVVIGAGVLGCSAAFHLANLGSKGVVLLDRGPIANGTTPMAAGQTGHLPTDTTMLEFVTYCVNFLEHFQKHTGFAIDYRKSGSIRVATTESGLEDLDARLAGARKIGQAAEMISPAQAKHMVPLLNLPHVKGILFAPGDGYVEPKSVAVAFAAAAQARGASISTNTNVSRLEVSNGEIKAVHTSRGSIATKRVVLSVGAWTRHFGTQNGANIKVVPVRHQAFVTAPINGVVPQQPIVRIIEQQIYVREEAGGLLVGGYGYRPTSFEMGDFPPRFEIAALEVDRIYFAKLHEAASAYFPVLRNSLVVQERRGLPTMSADARLVVSESEEIRGLVIASACGVGGIFQSPGIGLAAAELALGRPSSLPIDRLRANRFVGQFDDDDELRARCEDMYARMYLIPARH
jgi:4-methylaminobutanoate oxidase (formaldehyde-forming)